MQARSKVFKIPDVASAIQLIPFDKPPTTAQRQVEYLLRIKCSSATGKMRLSWFLWEKFRQLLGLSNDVPQLRLLQWKPVWLPVWLSDFVCIVPARLDGIDHDLDVSIFDMILPGTQVPPLNKAAIATGQGEALADILEDYDPADHSRLPESIRSEDDDLPDVVPVAFSFFPSDVPERLSRAFTAIRDEDVRIPGDANTVLYSAYPIYVPFYLLDYHDSNQKAGADGRKITACVQGRQSGLANGAGFREAMQAYSLPQWWCEEDQGWLPDFSYKQSFEIQGYRRNRAPPARDDSSEDSGFRSMSPIKSAQAAARSGSYSGSGLEQAHEAAASLRKNVEHAGQLMVEAMRDVLQAFRTSVVPTKPPMEFKEVSRTMDRFEGFMEYMPHAQLNREYVQKVNEMRIAQESLKHASAMPIVAEGQTMKTIIVEPSASTMKRKISIKTLNRDELKVYKEKIIKEQKRRLQEAIDEAEKAKPDWLNSQNKQN